MITAPSTIDRSLDGSRAKSWLAATIGLGAAWLPLLFLGSSGFGFISMEGMVLEGGSNMLATGEWLVPVLYGEVYTYKPPLAYWLAALVAQSSIGLPEPWQLRLPFQLCAAAFSLVTLVAVGRRTSPWTGWLCAVFAIGGVVGLEKVRLAEFDTLIASLVGIAVILAACELERSGPARCSAWLPAYGALYLAVLAKGVPALMAFAPGLLLAAALLGRARTLLSAAHLFAFCCFAAAIAVYVWSVVDAVGWAGFHQPAAEAQARGLSWTAPALLRSLAKPILIPAGFLPVAALLPLAVRDARAPCLSPGDRLTRAGLGFFAGGAAAFVVVPTHEMRYYLPMAASVALACGIPASRIRGPLPVGPRRLSVALGLLTLALAAVCAARSLGGQPFWLGSLFVLSLAATALPLRGAQASRRTLTVSVLLCTLAVGIAQGKFLVPARAASRALDHAADVLRAHVPPGERVFTPGPADAAGKYSSFFVYLRRPVVTFPPDQPESAGCTVLLTSTQWRELASSLQVEEVARATSPRVELVLGLRSRCSSRDAARHSGAGG